MTMRTRFLRGSALSLMIGSGVALAAGVTPAQAACNPLDPSATCLTFNPDTTSNILDRGGFTGQFSPPPGPQNAYNQVRLQFRFTGAWVVPFTLSGLSVKGDGITSSLSIPDKIVNFATNNFDDNNSAWGTLNTNINALDFANSLASLTIPAGVAPNGATLEARIQYRSINEAQLNSSGSNIFTTARIPSDVPGPLPILGAGIGLAFSRRLRGRIRTSV